MNRVHGKSCLCVACSLFAEGKNDPVLQRPKKSPEETQEAPAGQAQDDLTPPPGALRPWQQIVGDFRREERAILQDDSSRTLIPGPYTHYFLGADNLYEYNGRDAPKPLGEVIKGLVDACNDVASALHPHTNCPRCSEEKKPPEAGDPELQALISCMRTSAQETLVSLHRKGWKIVQA